jgi:hypothetical protein
VDELFSCFLFRFLQAGTTGIQAAIEITPQRAFGIHVTIEKNANYDLIRESCEIENRSVYRTDEKRVSIVEVRGSRDGRHENEGFRPSKCDAMIIDLMLEYLVMRVVHIHIVNHRVWYRGERVGDGKAGLRVFG